MSTNTLRSETSADAPKKGAVIVSGKAKSVHATEVADELILLFRDDTSAFDGKKKEKLADKGKVNNAINSFVMGFLNEHGVETHFIKQLSEQETLVRRLTMLPVEFVVRNRAAGSLCKRLGVERGISLEPPLLELFYKDDALGDPMITEAHARTFGWAREEDIRRGFEQTVRVNELLQALFADAGMILVDFKLEFGLYEGQLLLGDEFTPDGCRLWDSRSLDILDKDRFRETLGGVVDAYAEVAKRLGVKVTQ